MTDIVGGRTRARTWDPLIKSLRFSDSYQALSPAKSVNPATNGQWLSLDLSNPPRTKRVRKCSVAGLRLATLFAAITLGAAAVGKCHAADMMLEWRDGKWMPMSPADAARALAAPEHKIAKPDDKPQGLANGALTRARPVPSPSIEYPRPVYKLVDKPKILVAAVEPTTNAKASESAFYGVLEYLWWLAKVTFWLLFALLVLANLRGILRFVDGLFESPLQESSNEPAADELQTEAIADSLVLDLHDLVQTEFSAADYRKQTEVLRALKEKLDAEAESARATIRHERTRANEQQPGKDVP